MSLTNETLSTGDARVYRAPARVNLIGEHTDYNDGFVMPAAIDLYTLAAVRPRTDRKLTIFSDALSEGVEYNLDEPNPRARTHWSDYVRGVALMLENAGHKLRGADIVIRSNVPIGAGLSSSAALEVATGLAMIENSGIEIDCVELAKLCRQAENDFVGMRCGIMDQFISCFGKAGSAVMLDCRSLEYRLLPLPEAVRLVVCDTLVKHELGSSEYNTRRAQCDAGVKHFSKSLTDIRALRDVSLDDIERFGEDLDRVIAKRCRHVVTENSRVLKAAAALENSDLQVFGELMADSHRSLRDDYEVSCPELDTMVDLARSIEGVFGARMTGGGFGGCTINIVHIDAVADFERAVARGYERATGITPQIFVCSTADGAAEMINS